MIYNHKFFHWLYYVKNKRPYFNLGTGVFIWLFLWLTKPFGIYENNLSNQLFLIAFLLPFGLVWPLISYFIDFIVKRFYQDRARKEYRFDFFMLLLKAVLLIHTYFLIRNVFCNWNCVDVREYFELWFASMLMITIIYVPFSLFARSRFLHGMIGTNDEKEEGYFELHVDGKEVLRISLLELLYAKADDNYVDLFLTVPEQGVKKITARTTLKSLTAQLVSHSQFIRVHRSYVINSQFVIGVTKDHVLLSYGDHKIEIPISKKYRNDFNALIQT